MPTASLSLFRFDGTVNRLWVIAQMGAARLTLRREPALFWKLCGSGTGHGFTPRPNWGVWAILAVWPDEATARDRTAKGATFARWRRRAAEEATIFLHPTSSRGEWSGREPFMQGVKSGAQGTDMTGPLAALTRATVRPRNLWRFWTRVPDIQQVIGADPSVRFKIGIGEVPFLHQVTFSIWPDAEAMARFARKDGPHARAIRAVRDGQWFAEELYARFTVTHATGIWEGRPLHDTLFRKAA